MEECSGAVAEGRQTADSRRRAEAQWLGFNTSPMQGARDGLEPAASSGDPALTTGRRPHTDAVHAAGVAHDLCNLLTLILGHAEIARALGCDDAFVEQITYSSPMHDIGKISVPSEILGKPGKLTREEFEIIKQHTVKGAQILEGIPFLTMAREIALTHHEHFDGAGYPGGLRGSDIPLSGRIVAIADVFDALISRRPYKPPHSFADALHTLSQEADKHFDGQILGVFLGMADRVCEIAVQLRDETGRGPGAGPPFPSAMPAPEPASAPEAEPMPAAAQHP